MVKETIVTSEKLMSLFQLEAGKEQSIETYRRRVWMSKLKELFEEECPVLYRASDPSRMNAEALLKIQSFKVCEGRGMMLMGDTGKGKTRLAWMAVKKIMLEDGLMCRAIDDPSFSREYSKRLGNGQAEEWMNSLCRTAVVLLDDLGKAAVTPRYKEQVYDLLETRMKHCRPLIITTQLGKGQLMERFGDEDGNAIIRRILEFCDIVKL